MSPQIVQKVLIFFLSTQNLKGTASVFLSRPFWSSFLSFSPHLRKKLQNYTIGDFFSHEGISCLGAGDRDTSQRETQKRKRGRRFIQGLSGFRDSWRLRLCTNVILHESLLALPVFCQRKRQRFTHDDVPARSGKHRSFLWKRNIFFFFSVKLFIQSKWWMFVHNWLRVPHWNCFVTVSHTTAVCD